MMDRELQDLRRRLAGVSRGRGRRYPALVRERILAWAAARRPREDWWRELSDELGIPEKTLQRWAASRPTPALSLRPVDVIDEPAERTVTVVSPSGIRIEGVTIADAITILKGLA
jgi:hypothetical protein